MSLQKPVQDLCDFQKDMSSWSFLFSRSCCFAQYNFSYLKNWEIGSFMSSVPWSSPFSLPSLLGWHKFFGFSYAWHLPILHLFLSALYCFALTSFTIKVELKGHVLWNITDRQGKKHTVFLGCQHEGMIWIQDWREPRTKGRQWKSLQAGYCNERSELYDFCGYPFDAKI